MEYVFNRNCDNAPRRPGQRAFPQITSAAGLSVKALLGPNDQRVFYNLYVEAGQQLTTALRAQAALKVSPEGAYASHHTAARLWGAWAPESPETHVSVPGDVGRSKRRGIVAHEGVGKPLPTVCRGLALSTPAQTFLDLAGSGFNLVDLVASGDSIIRRTGLEAADLVEAADRWRGHGAGRARRAARLVRDGVDSVMESRLRMLIVLAGLPEPRVNVKLRHDNGEWWMRFDLCYEDCRLVVGYDGVQHRDDEAQRLHDIKRREELDRLRYPRRHRDVAPPQQRAARDPAPHPRGPRRLRRPQGPAPIQAGVGTLLPRAALTGTTAKRGRLQPQRRQRPPDRPD